MTDVEQILSVLLTRIEETKQKLPIESYVRRSTGQLLRVAVEEVSEASIIVSEPPSPIVGARSEALSITAAAGAGDTIVNIWNDPEHRTPNGGASYIVENPPGEACACCKGSGLHRSERSSVYRIPTAEASGTE